MNPPSDKVRVRTPLDGKLLRIARIADTSSFHCGSVSKYLCLSQCISVFQLSADFFPYILNIFTAYIQRRAGQIRVMRGVTVYSFCTFLSATRGVCSSAIALEGYIFQCH